MRYLQLGSTGLRVSAVSLGTWAMGGDYWGPIDEQQCIDALRAGLDHGINCIDTAPIYGHGYSETIVGRAIQGRKREDIIIATKCGVPGPNARNTSRASILKEIEGSLTHLGTDYIDLYQVHWPDPNTEPAETMDTLLDLKRQGKIRFIGVSNFGIPLIEAYRALGPIDSLQPQYSLLERKIESDLLPYCHKENIGVLTYGSLGAGLLSGKYTQAPKVEEGERRAVFYKFYQEPYFSKALELVETLRQVADAHDCPISQVAINWVAQQPGVTTALVGCKTPAQAIENARAGEWSLSTEELCLITEACDRIVNQL